MVRPRARLLALAAAGLAVAQCQVIAGVEDKQLDPKYLAGSGGNEADVALPEAAPEAGPRPNRPPPRPGGWNPGGVRRWFAARRIFIGSIDPDSPPAQAVHDDKAWRRFGHDLDGECTTLAQSKSDTSAVCKKPPGAAADSLEDGENCRDNAAGRLVAVGTQVLSSDFELKLHKKLEAGQSATFLLELSDLGSGPDDPEVPGALFVTLPHPSPPLWDGSDVLAIDARSVAPLDTDGGEPDAAADAEAGTVSEAGADADAEAAVPTAPIVSRYEFPNGYLAGNVWVSGDFNQTAMELPLFIFGSITPAEVLAINLEIELDAEHTRALWSTMSVVTSRNVLDTRFRPIAYEMVGCIDFLATTFMDQYLFPAMDLAEQPTSFVDPSGACSALALGFGFDWVAVRQPWLVSFAPPEPPKCP
jgi:hypothetical protein